MAEENVKVDLQSSADTTGFEKFEASYNSLAAAKQENIRANGIFSDSERRVRVNLADLVTGLGGAQDGTQALSLAVGHLSEVFELGFAGTVIAGVGAALIAQFSKVTEEIEKTETAMKKTGEELDNLEREVTGVKLTPAEQHTAKIAQQSKDIDAEREQTESRGIFKMIRLGLSDLFGGTMREDLRKQLEESNQALSHLSKIAREEGDVEAKSYTRQFGPTVAEKPNNVAFEQLVKEQEDQQDFAARQKKIADEKAATAKRSTEETAKEAARVSQEQERAAAAAESQAARDEEPRRSGRIQAHIYAGAQRSVGGGGGVYSTIVRDPVVEEARKHTNLLTEIANSVKVLKSPAPAIPAALA